MVETRHDPTESPNTGGSAASSSPVIQQSQEAPLVQPQSEVPTLMTQEELTRAQEQLKILSSTVDVRRTCDVQEQRTAQLRIQVKHLAGRFASDGQEEEEISIFLLRGAWSRSPSRKSAHPPTAFEGMSRQQQCDLMQLSCLQFSNIFDFNEPMHERTTSLHMIWI